MKVTIKPYKPVSDAATIELLFEIAKAFADMEINEGDDEYEFDLSDLPQRIPCCSA